jgi:hypothetical protein
MVTRTAASRAILAIVNRPDHKVQGKTGQRGAASEKGVKGILPETYSIGAINIADVIENVKE